MRLRNRLRNTSQPDKTLIWNGNSCISAFTYRLRNRLRTTYRLRNRLRTTYVAVNAFT